MSKYREIVRQHKPRGWRLIEKSRPPGSNLAYMYDRSATSFGDRIIVCEPICDRVTLWAFLHECGHVHAKHHIHEDSCWREEYEADCYATAALRAAGIPVPHKGIVREHKAFLRAEIARSTETVDDDRILKYAFGSNWRKHR